MESFLKQVPREMRIAGLRETMRALREGNVKRVLIARDADNDIQNLIAKTCTDLGINFRFVSDKEEIGRLLNLDVGCAVVAQRITAK